MNVNLIDFSVIVQVSVKTGNFEGQASWVDHKELGKSKYGVSLLNLQTLSWTRQRENSLSQEHLLMKSCTSQYWPATTFETMW